MLLGCTPLLPVFSLTVRWGVDMGAFPTIARVNAALSSLPAFQAAHPDAQPDAQK